MIFSVKVAAIEFAGDDVRIAVIKTGAGLPTVLELHSARAVYGAPEERSAALTAALDSLLGRLQSRPAVFVLVASSMFSLVRSITIPFRGRRRVATAVPFELEPYLAFPLEELLLDFTVVAEAKGETDVFAMGIRRAQLDEHLAVIKAAGIEVESVSLDAVAMTGLWQAGRKGLKGLNAVLHVRADCCSLAITWNRTLAYFRHLQCTAEQLRSEPSTVAREVQNTLRAFLAKWRHGGDIASLHVTGVELSQELHRAFEDAVRLPVNEEVVISRLSGGARAADNRLGNTWEAAIGAAMGAAGQGYSIDLGRAEADWGSSVRGVISHVLFSAVLALMALLGWAFYYHQGATQNRAEAARLQSQIDALQEEIDAIAMEGIDPDIDIQPFSDPTLLAILKEIGARVPGNTVTITQIKMSQPGVRSAWLEITGTATDAERFNQAYASLRQSPLFKFEEDPEVNVVREVTRFTVKASRPDRPVVEDVPDESEAAAEPVLPMEGAESAAPPESAIEGASPEGAPAPPTVEGEAPAAEGAPAPPAPEGEAAAEGAPAEGSTGGAVPAGEQSEAVTDGAVLETGAAAASTEEAGS